VPENLFPPMRCGTGKGQVAGCGVAPTVLHFSTDNLQNLKMLFTSNSFIDFSIQYQMPFDSQSMLWLIFFLLAFQS
jgi:hypothetical protein